MTMLSLHSFPKNRRRSALALMELVIVLILFSVFLLIASKLFIVSLTAQNNANKQDSLIHEVDSALSLLRKDVWASNHITYDEGQLKLLGPNDGPIQWDLRDPEHLSRTTPHTTTAWSHIPKPTLQLAGPLVKLSFPTKATPASTATESLTFVSEPLLINGAQ